jgi:hypothetical protein
MLARTISAIGRQGFFDDKAWVMGFIVGMVETVGWLRSGSLPNSPGDCNIFFQAALEHYQYCESEIRTSQPVGFPPEGASATGIAPSALNHREH